MGVDAEVKFVECIFASVLLSASTAGDSVSVGELLRGLRSHHGAGALKRRLTEAEGKIQPLKPPLPKPQAEWVREGNGGRCRRSGGREKVPSSYM